MAGRSKSSAGAGQTPQNPEQAQQTSGVEGSTEGPRARPTKHGVVIPLSDYIYFTESETDRVVDNLISLKSKIYPNIQNREVLDKQCTFPSVCLVGLGRCGSNVSLDLASLVYNARNFYMSRQHIDHDKSGGALSWLRGRLKGQKNSQQSAAFLVEPLVMLGDLDKDIEGRVKFSQTPERTNLQQGYTKLRVMDLAEIHAGGSGNAPVLGQYLAKIILNKGADQFSSEEWQYIHSYLIDSCGIKANQSRLFFYIFSAGGGTGSGMASEFGLAQQYSYMSKTLDTQERRPIKSALDDARSFVFEPIFSSGICILPNISCQSVEISEALHINAGRLLCKYLSEEWDFSYNMNAQRELEERSVIERLRPWNAMMLISNDIMRYAEESEGTDMHNVDVNTMEKYANQYISQQIFNILTAQAVTTDYDQDYFRRAGIDISETIRLDANDLFMSMAGPITIAYAESVVVKREAHPANSSETINEVVELDIDDLFFRSIDLPHFNKDTKAIEGVSLLPIEASRYKALMTECRKNKYSSEALKQLAFYSQCSSVVSIISLPKDYKLSYMDLNALKKHLNSLFPNTTLKRYALVVGASTNISLTTLVAKSPCLSDDFLTLMVSYIKRCFVKNEYCYDGAFDKLFIELIKNEHFDEERLDAMIEELENPAKILDTNWFAIKPMYEKKYREIIGEDKPFVSINDIRLSADNVKRAIYYLREIYRYRVSKTSTISLNNSVPSKPIITVNPPAE